MCVDSVLLDLNDFTKYSKYHVEKCRGADSCMVIELDDNYHRCIKILEKGKKCIKHISDAVLDFENLYSDNRRSFESTVSS